MTSAEMGAARPTLAVRSRRERSEVHGIALPLRAETIAKILPHTGLFALLDRVTAIDPGRSATGLKLVTRTDPVLSDHFPGRPIVPGVLLIESLGQLCGIVLWSSPRDAAASPGSGQAFGVLAGVKRFRFRDLVVPGDAVTLQARLVARAGALVEFEVAARVERELVADGTVQIGFRTDPLGPADAVGSEGDEASW